MESGPYRRAAESLAAVAISSRQSVGCVLDASRLLTDLGEPTDPALLEFMHLIDRIDRDIVAPLQDAARSKETSARTKLGRIAQALAPLLRDIEMIQTTKQTTEKSIVAVDVVSYSRLASTVENVAGTEALLSLNDRIQGILNESLKATNRSPEDSLITTTGDGAILAFDEVQDAVRFAEALQNRALEQNRSLGEGVKLQFRIGISCGRVAIAARLDSTNIAGVAIVEAVRLSSACKPGGILASEAVWRRLPKDTQRRYGSHDVIPGKLHERISVRSYRLNPQDN